MIKRILLILFLLITISFSVFSQISVKSFELLETDLDASTYNPKKDFNGKNSAIIKVFTTQTGFSFDNGSLGIVATEYKPAEIWVYVPDGTRKLKIVHPQLGHISNSGSSDGYYWFPSGRVKSGCCYKLELVTGVVHTVFEGIKKQTGWLIIDSNPSGAEVYIEENGKEQFFGTTPFQRKMLYGKYNYSIKKSKYHDEIGVALIDNKKVEILADLKPAFGSILVTSEPTGAKVYLDGDFTNMSTPCVLKQVLSGSHSIRVQKENYAPQVQQIIVNDGLESNVDIRMESVFATVEVNSIKGAKLKVNGEYCGETSCKLNLQEGFYEIEASLNKHKSVKELIEVVAMQSMKLELQPIPIYGSLDVISSPRNARISINGENYGYTPNTIDNLLIGEYEVNLSLSGYEPEKRTVMITENTTSMVNITFNSQNKKNNTKVQKDLQVQVARNYKTMDIAEKEKSEKVTERIKPKECRYKLEDVVWNDSVSDNQKKVIRRIIENMIKVEGGMFVMGTSKEQDSESEEDERITHNVHLNDFFIGKYEVTQAEWEALMEDNPSNFKGENKPVEKVSWDDCKRFIYKLNQYTGFNFRLPTEAEWEYAARGGKKSKGYKYSGDDNLQNVAWFFEQRQNGTHPVGLKNANELGLYDMSGNVYEWCEDWYEVYSKNTEYNPKGYSSGRTKVFRGGSWSNLSKHCRVTYRCNDFPKSKFSYIGFRLVLGLD